MRLTGIIALILFILSIAPVCGQDIDIYVHNKLLQGEKKQVGDEIYVSGEVLKGLLKDPISWDEGTGVITLKDEATSLKIIRSGKTVLVPLKAIAKALDLKMSYNKDTGILDVFKQAPPQKETPQVTQTNPQTGQNPQASPTPGASPGAPDLLTITEKSAMPDGADPAKAGLRIYAEVTNGRSATAKNVIATCSLKDFEGKVITQQQAQAGDLNPGEKKEVLFYFNNTGGVDFTKAYTVKSD